MPNREFIDGDVKDEDIMDVKTIPKAFHKVKLWIRQREYQHGLLYEARLLSMGNRTLLSVAKFFVIDTTFAKNMAREVLFNGFTCCFCNNSYRLTKDLELQKVAEKYPSDKYRCLCGTCWTGGHRSQKE